MKIQQQQLISDLRQMTEETLNRFEKFQELEIETLNWRESEDKWSILECFEHLNLYGEFYIPECKKRIQTKLISSTKTEQFRSGLLGNYFAKLMLPSIKLKKIESPKDKNPIFSNLDKSVLEKFRDQQHEILKLLSISDGLNLTKIKTSISLSNLIKLRLGDTYRVVIYHNFRHLIQAEVILTKAKSSLFSAL